MIKFIELIHLFIMGLKMVKDFYFAKGIIFYNFHRDYFFHQFVHFD